MSLNPAPYCVPNTRVSITRIWLVNIGSSSLSGPKAESKLCLSYRAPWSNSHRLKQRLIRINLMTLAPSKSAGNSDIGVVSKSGLVVSAGFTVSIQTRPRATLLGRPFHSKPRTPAFKRHLRLSCEPRHHASFPRRAKPGF